MLSRRTFIAGIACVLMACSTAAGATKVIVFKNPSCGCCGAWVDHMKAEGFKVEIRELEDATPIARRLGVPDELRSCHTAQVGSYFVEGHVPAADVRKLLKDRPNARGIAVPGMPVGSPGMEQGETREPYDTLLIGKDGSVKSFATHNRPKAS